MRNTIHKLQNETETAKRNGEAATAKMKEANEKALIELAEQYKAKLIVEYQKYENLEDSHKALRKTNEKKMREVEKAKEEAVKKIRKDFNVKLERKDEDIRKREAEAEVRVKAVEEMLRQTEEDADKEILEMKTKYERLLRSEREGNVRLR